MHCHRLLNMLIRSINSIAGVLIKHIRFDQRSLKAHLDRRVPDSWAAQHKVRTGSMYHVAYLARNPTDLPSSLDIKPKSKQGALFFFFFRAVPYMLSFTISETTAV